MLLRWVRIKVVGPSRGAPAPTAPLPPPAPPPPAAPPLTATPPPTHTQTNHRRPQTNGAHQLPEGVALEVRDAPRVGVRQQHAPQRERRRGGRQQDHVAVVIALVLVVELCWGGAVIYWCWLVVLPDALVASHPCAPTAHTTHCTRHHARPHASNANCCARAHLVHQPLHRLGVEVAQKDEVAAALAARVAVCICLCLFVDVDGVFVVFLGLDQRGRPTAAAAAAEAAMLQPSAARSDPPLPPGHPPAQPHLPRWYFVAVLSASTRRPVISGSAVNATRSISTTTACVSHHDGE